MLIKQAFETDRLRLDPIAVEDAEALVDVFDHPSMVVYIGGEVPRDVLLGRFQRMPAGSGTDDEIWLTWTIRRGGAIIGIVQATIRDAGADLAWVIGLEWQKQGFASEAASAMCEWLESNDVTAYLAHIHPDNLASHAVATKLGLRPSGEIDDDGEEVWVNADAVRPSPESADGQAR